MLAHLNEDEQLAIQTFAAWYRDPDHKEPWTRDVVLKYFDWSESRFHVVMHRLEGLGLVSDQSTSGIEFLTFTIEPEICGAAEELRAAEIQRPGGQPPDFLESVIRSARTRPLLTWSIALALAAAIVLTIVNGLFELAKNVLALFGGGPPAP